MSIRKKKKIVESLVKNLEKEIRSIELPSEDLDWRGDKGDKATTLQVLESISLSEERKRKLSLSVSYLKSLLLSLSKHETVQEGSLVEVQNGERLRFLIVSADNFPVGMIENGQVTVITTRSPMGKALLGKKRGDRVVVGGKEIEILSVS